MLCVTSFAVRQVTQYNVTFEFGSDVKSGQYVNGDYWVVGPVSLTSVTPPFISNPGSNGMQINPTDVQQSAYDHRIDHYNESMVACSTLPCTLKPGDKVIKAVSMPETFEDSKQYKVGNDSTFVKLTTAVVLTVVSSPPASDAFRPPYFGTAVFPEYRLSQIDISLLPSLAPPPIANISNIPTLEDITQWHQRVQLDYKYQWVGCELHPLLNMPVYGVDISNHVSDACLRLMLNDSKEEKLKAAIGLIQYGLDIYSIVKGGGGWTPNGGWQNGRKLPIVLASYLFNDKDMQKTILSAGINTWAEDSTFNRQPKNAKVPIWGPFYGNKNPKYDETYWQSVVKNPGNTDGYDPYEWIDGDSRPGLGYQFCCNSQIFKGTFLSIYLVSPMRDIWNDTYWEQYVMRWVTVGAWAQPDPCAPATGTCNGGPNDGKPCTSAFPDKACGETQYCILSMDDYGKQFGPDGKGGCILDSDHSDGIGRFPQYQGYAKNGGYSGSAFAAAMWDAYGPK
jgi:hypothetical protein